MAYEISKKLEELKANLKALNETRTEALNYAEELKQRILLTQGAIQILEEIQAGDKDVSNEN
jgi:hypothetical protein